jgi:hypothetical protein
LLALAYLRNGHSYAELAAGFGIGTTTAYRYTTETIDLLASLAPTLAEVTRAASTKAYVLLDGTLLPIDGIAADQPFWAGWTVKSIRGAVLVSSTSPFPWTACRTGRARFRAPGAPQVLFQTRVLSS